MNDIELTQVFIDYARTKANLKTYEGIIETEILKRAESAKIAGVTATYYKSSAGTPKYEEAVVQAIGAEPALQDDLRLFQKVTVSTSWKDACEAWNLTPEPGEEKPARVVIK